MNKTFVYLFAFFSFFLFSFTVANSQEQPKLGYVSLSASTTKEVSPDTVTLSFAVETNDSDQSKAIKSNTENINKVVNALKSKIDTTKGEYIKTDSYSVRPRYNYTKDNKKNLVGYTVYNSVTVKIKDVQNAGIYSDIAVSNGATSVEGVSFSFQNDRNACNDMYPTLLSDLKNQANIIAKSLGTTVKGVRTISTSCGSSYSSKRAYGIMSAKSMLNDAAVEASPQLEAGKLQINLHIDASFFLN